jgi:hypothetical protein
MEDGGGGGGGGGCVEGNTHTAFSIDSVAFFTAFPTTPSCEHAAEAERGHACEYAAEAEHAAEAERGHACEYAVEGEHAAEGERGHACARAQVSDCVRARSVDMQRAHACTQQQHPNIGHLQRTLHSTKGTQ